MVWLAIELIVGAEFAPAGGVGIDCEEPPPPLQPAARDAVPSTIAILVAMSFMTSPPLSENRA
jgi:hypothetical protein